MFFTPADYFTITEPIIQELFDRADCFPISMRVLRLLIKDRGEDINYLEFGTGRLCSSFAVANLPNVKSVLSVDINPFYTNEGYKFGRGNRPLHKFERYGAPKVGSPDSEWETKSDIFKRLSEVIDGHHKITYWDKKNTHKMSTKDFKGVGPFDVIYIDGDHSKEGVINDWNLAKKIIKPDGLIIFDDWGDSNCKPVRDGIKETAMQEYTNIFENLGWHCTIDFRKMDN